MKKSFLKRVAAAAVAVPVALTQTALFTSFAEGETTTTTTNKNTGSVTISLDTLMKVDASSELVGAADFKKNVKTDVKFSAGELTKNNAYVQFSNWGKDAALGLMSFSGTYNLPKEELAKALESKNGAKFDLVKNAIADKNTTVVATVSPEKVEITINIDYAYGQDLANMATEAMNATIAKKYDDVTVTVVPTALKNNKLTGTIVMTADMTAVEDKTVKFNATVKMNGVEQKGADAVEKFFADEAKDALTKLKADAGAAVDQAIKDNQDILDDANKQLTDADKKAADAQEKFDAADKQFKAADEKLTKAEADLAQAKEDGVTGAALAEKETEVKNARADYNTKKADYDTKKADFEQKKAKLADAHKKVDDAQKALDDANKTAHENLQSYADDLQATINKYQAKVDNRKNFGEKSFEVNKVADADAALAEADKKFSKAPASLSALEGSKYYSKLVKAFDKAVEFINTEANNGGKINITSDDVMNVVKGASNFSVYADVNAKSGVYTAKGETLFYVKDDVTAAEKETIIKQLNEKNEFVKNNVEVDPATLVTVKVVEAQGALDASTKFEGDATVDIYRIVYFDTMEKKATETTPSETETTESTSTETTPIVTEPTESTSTETTPVVTEPTESTSTETTPTETTPTESTSTETTPVVTEPTETTTTTKHTKVAGEIEMNVTVKTEMAAGAGFYFDNDKNAFTPDSLAELPNESPEMEGAVVADKFTVGDAAKNLTPEELYEANKAEDAYVVKALQLYYNGLKVVDKDRNPVTMTVYVGVKGDLTQDGACNAKDANAALRHAAAVGTTPEGQDLPTINDLGDVKTPAAAVQATFDKFLIFLGDVDTESVKGELPKEKIAVNANDANAMLRYAAKVGTNKKPGEEGFKTAAELWTEVFGENLPTYFKLVANTEALKKLA